MSIQLENGYTKIANELLDVFARINLSGREWQILFAIIRKTYGFKKKTDRISLSQLEKITGIQSNHCSGLIKKLEKKKIIVVKKNGYSPNEYSLNKQYLNRDFGTPQIGRHKRYYTKDNNTQSKIADNKKPMYEEPTIELDENGEPIKRKEIKKTFGRYPAKLAKYYCEIMGKRSASRQLPSAKELFQLAQQDFPDDSMEEWFTEIKGRINVALKYYNGKNIKDWNLSKVAENWDKILKWSTKLQ